MAEADELVRWTVKVSKDTDVSLRSFLARRGLKKGDLSKFIERAVQKEVFAQTVAGVQARNANVPDEEIEGAIEDALREVRAEMVRPGHRAAARGASARRSRVAGHPRHERPAECPDPGRLETLQARPRPAR